VLRLVVDDNGCGPGGGRFGYGRGLGVIDMRERAQSLGGTFAIKEREAEQMVSVLPSRCAWITLRKLETQSPE